MIIFVLFYFIGVKKKGFWPYGIIKIVGGNLMIKNIKKKTIKI